MQIVNSDEYHTSGYYEQVLVYIGESNGRPLFENEMNKIDLRWNGDLQAWTVTGGQITFVSYSNVTNPTDASGWTYHPDGIGPNAGVFEAPNFIIIPLTPTAAGSLTFNIIKPTFT